jgi:hypothetical protein
MLMMFADFEPADSSAPDVADDFQIMRGLLNAFALSVPLWAAIIALVQLAI